MAHTERRRQIHDDNGAHINPSARDIGCDHWECTRWKRVDRRAQRHRAKQALRLDPDDASPKSRARWIP